jgi:hypothetical protein
MIAKFMLSLLGIYLLCGLLFAPPFLLMGVKHIDPHAQHGSWGFRLLILPGCVLLWPLLLHRWLGRTGHPPEERNAHRLAARKEGKL